LEAPAFRRGERHRFSFTETYTEPAKALLRRWQQASIHIAAPTLFRYEIISVMRKSAFRSLFTADEALKSRDFLMEYPVHLMIDDDLLRRGYDLAAKFNRPTAYDAQYLAVAERLKCEFWTADERLVNAVQKDLSWVKWIGNFQLETENE
jgi:predicted nucleic acid-binding protein